MKLNIKNITLISLFLLGVLLLLFRLLAKPSVTPPIPTPTPGTFPIVSPTVPSFSITNQSALQTKVFAPKEAIPIEFSSSPQAESCVVTMPIINADIFTSEPIENVLALHPKTEWSSGRIPFLIKCNSFSQTIQILIGTELNASPISTPVAGDESKVGVAQIQYLKTHPYFTQFPVYRQTYTMVYQTGNSTIYVALVSNETLSDTQLAQIEQNERPYLQSIGVPDSVPLTTTIQE